MEPDNKEPSSASPTVDQIRNAPIPPSDLESYIEGVKTGKIIPSKEDLKGFLPTKGIERSGSAALGSQYRVREAAEQAREKTQQEIDKPYIAPGLRKNTPEDNAKVEQAGITAATEQQHKDLELASGALIRTIQTDPMFFRGMQIHHKITSGEEPFEIGKDGMLTDKGKMDLADYKYFYDHPKRGITFMHGASTMLATLKFEISDTIEHLVDDPTVVINDYYKDKPNYKSLQAEARDFVMMGVQQKISTSELTSGKVDTDRAIKVAELQGRPVEEVIKNREMYINLYKRFTNPPEAVINGKKVKPEPMFKLPGTWESAGNKLSGAVEAMGRVLKGWGDLAVDASKDPLSWHGSLDDSFHRNAMVEQAGYESNPEIKERLLKIAAEPDGHTITAQRLNRAGRDIKQMSRWASGEVMMFGEAYMSNGGRSEADPNIWTPGQTWIDPIALYSLGSGAFRALGAASAAETSMMARYAAVSKVASLEAFTLELANTTKQFAGIGNIMQEIGRAYLAEIGKDITTLTADQIQEIGMKRMLSAPFQSIKAGFFTDQILNELMNSVPRPEGLASITDDQWQLMSGKQKLAALEPPAAFAGVENGADIWSKMSVEQRANIVVAERVTEIHKLARARQAKAIADAVAASKNAAEASTEANSNASVVRRTAGATTSAFGEWVLGGREMGNGFWKDLSVAGLANHTADLIDSSIKWVFTKAAGEASGELAEQWLRDQASARFVARTMVGLGAAAGLNGLDAYMGHDSAWVKYPKYIVNTLGFIVGMRVIGANSQSMGRFMRAWGDEIARGDPTLWRGYAQKIAKNPEAYGFDPKEPFGPAAVATFMSNFGIESILRFGKRNLYDFGLKGGGVAELVVYGKDRDSIGQGAAIGTVFSAVGYYGAMGAEWALGSNKLNAMRSDALFRAMHTSGGDPTNILNFIDAHSAAAKGGYEKDFLGFFLGVDNSTRGKVRFIDDKMASTLRFAYDYGLKDQSEAIRKSVALGFKTPEDIIGSTLKQEQINKAVAEVTNRLNQEANTLNIDVTQNLDVIKQLGERLKNPALSKEEKVDIATQIKMVRAKINQSKNRVNEISTSLKGSDQIAFLRENGVDIDTINARVRSGINETTGNPVMTFKGLTIETTKDGPIVYINKDKMNSAALWHEAGEAVLLAGSVEHVVADATKVMFGDVGANPDVIARNKKIYEEAVKNGEDVNSPEFLRKIFGDDAFKRGSRPTLSASILDRMLDAHAESAGLDDAWKMNARAAVREYLVTGNKFGLDNLTREIFANYLGLYLEQSPKLRLFSHGDLYMTLEGFTDRAFGWLANDTDVQLNGRNQLYTNDNTRIQEGLPKPEDIRAFFIDPTTGKKVQIKAFERLAREAIRRSNKYGTTKDGKPTVDLKKMSPEDRRSWVTANNVKHWLNDDGELRSPQEIVDIESTMTHQSMVDLDQFRNDNPTSIRTRKDVKKTKDGSTTVIDGVFSPGELNAMLQNPELPENVRATILAYSKAVYRTDGKIGLMQGMYSGESKETVYTPNSTPSLREWGSPLLMPEHRAMLPLSMSVSWETDASGITKTAAVRVNGLDWKAIDKRVIIAAGSDLAVQHGITVSEIYGYMNDYITNLNKGNSNQDPKQNAIPSAQLFFPNADGTASSKGENIRDLMHFIFDFQKKKNDAYINQPADWGELGLRGPTHPYTSFRADRWTSPEASDEGAFIRVNEAAYKLSQGNFMGEGTPKRKLNRKDVSETTPEKEAEAQRKIIGETQDIPPLREQGKVVDPLEQLPTNKEDLFGRISDLYAKDGEVMPPLMRKWFEAYEARFTQYPPKNLVQFGKDFQMYIESDAKDGRKHNKNKQDRAQYFLPIIEEFNRKIQKLSEQPKATVAEEKPAETAPVTETTQGTQPEPVDVQMTAGAKKDLATASSHINVNRAHIDTIDMNRPGVVMHSGDRAFFVNQLKKHLDAAFAIKPNFDPGFDIYQYLPDYEKPATAEQAKPKAETGTAQNPKVTNVKIPYTSKKFISTGNVQDISGTADIIRFGSPGDDRLAVVRNINGVNVPFYLSTGRGGKTDVPAGKWYPFFGISESGWINKTGGPEMANYHGSSILRSVAERLDATIGDIRDSADKYPKAPLSGLSFLNEGLTPVENGTPTTRAQVEANIKSVIDRINAGETAPAAEAKPAPAAEAKPAPAAENAPTTNVELQKLLINFSKDFQAKHRWDDAKYMNDFRARIKEIYDKGGTKEDVINKLGVTPDSNAAYSIGTVFAELEKQKNNTSKPKNPTEPAPAAKPATTLNLNDPKVVAWRQENGITNNKGAQWIEPPSKEIMKVIDGPFAKAADLIETARIDGSGSSYYAEAGKQLQDALKKAKEMGLTPQQFYAMYDLGKGSNKKALQQIVETIMGRPFPKEGLSNVLAPSSAAEKQFGAKPAAKPNKEANASGTPRKFEEVFEKKKDLSNVYHDMDGVDMLSQAIYWGPRKKDARGNMHGGWSVQIFEYPSQPGYESKYFNFDTKEELIAKYDELLKKYSFKYTGAKDKKNKPADNPKNEAKPTTTAEIPKELAPKEKPAATKYDIETEKAELTRLLDSMDFGKGEKANSTKISYAIPVINNLIKAGMDPHEIRGFINEHVNGGLLMKYTYPEAESAEAKPAPGAKPTKKLEAEADKILGSDFFETHRMLRDDPENWGSRKPNSDKKGFTNYAKETVKRLEAAGITPDMVKAMGYDVTQWKSTSNWDKEGLQILRDWANKGSAAKPAVEIPKELAPKSEPVSESKPKWDEKKAKKIVSEINKTIEEWEEANNDDGLTFDQEDTLHELVGQLAEMGMRRTDIENLLGGNDTSEESIRMALDGIYPEDENESAATGSSGGAKPPKKPKPTAEAAGDEEPAPKPNKPKQPKQPDVVIPDAPLIRNHPTDFGNDNDPKKNANQIKQKYGTMVRKEVDTLHASVMQQAREAVTEALKVKLDNRADTKTIEKSREAVKLALIALSDLEATRVTGLGIAAFDNSSAVRFRFLEMYEDHYRDWFSKTQRTEFKKLRESLQSHEKRIDAVSARRTVDDFIGLTGSVDITGSRPGQKGQSTLKVVSSKTPWVMADDRALLPITSRINDFIVTECFVDPNAKTGAVGTSGLIFLDTKQKTPKGQDALYNVLNQIFDTNYFGAGGAGFYDIKVLNANGDLKNFRISTFGNRGLDPKELQKRYAEAKAKQLENKEPGKPMPALEFDANGTSYSSDKAGVALMKAEIDEFLRQGQLDKIEFEKKESNRREIEARRKQRKADAEAKEAEEQKKQEEAAKLAQIKLGLYGRQPLDPANPGTAMNVVEGSRSVVSRRADNLIEIRKGKDKDTDTDVFRVHYMGDTFGGPRMVLQTNSIEAAHNLAQSYTPFEGYRTALLSLIEGLDIQETGPWFDKDMKPTNDPKQVAPISVLLGKYEDQFGDALTRIRASGTYGIVDAGNGEFVVVPKKSIRDKNGNLDLSNPRIRLSRRLVLKALEIAQEAEDIKKQRQAANAQLPAPRQPQAQPAQGQQPQPAAGTPPPGVDVQAFTNERMNMILQSARNDANMSKMESAAGVLKILTNRDNMKLMYMKNGTIRVYGANNNLLAETKDEDDAFGWLIK